MLSDFESDLTELSSDEEEYVPPSQKRKTRAQRGKSEEYKVTNALRPPRTTQYSAKSLYDQMVEQTINLDPEYQRDVVWPETKQTGLIDSILRNYYIPPVIFAVSTSDDGTETRTCIDGKQRLTSIQRFMDGVISHKDSVTNKRYWYKDGPGSGPKRNLLPRQYMQAFANKQITCVEYDSLTDDQEREIFQRVQLGVALTPAERMQANTGVWSSLIRDVQSKVLGADGFGDDLDWGRTRGRDFQCLASIVYLIDHSPETAFPGAAQLDKWIQTSKELPPKFHDDVLETFKTFVALVKDKRYNAAFQKPTRVSPIEFTMIGVLIHKFRTKLSMSQLSTAISKMRADVRAKHVDIRANTKVTRTLFSYIKGLKIDQFKADGRGESLTSVAIRSSATMKHLQKRKRVESSDSEEETPLKKTTTSKTSAPKPTSRPIASKLAVGDSPRTRQGVDTRTVATTKASSSSRVTVTRVVTTSKSAARQTATSPSKASTSSATTKSTSSNSPTTSKAGSTPVSTPSTEQSKPTPLPRTKGPTLNTPSTPLPLPRTSPLTGQKSNAIQNAQTPIKAEPVVESLRSTDVPPPTLATPTVPNGTDRLASLRAARASFTTIPGQSSVKPHGATAAVPGQSLPDSRLNGAPPNVKKEPTHQSLFGANVNDVHTSPPPLPQTSPAQTISGEIDPVRLQQLIAQHFPQASAPPLAGPPVPPPGLVAAIQHQNGVTNIPPSVDLPMPLPGLVAATQPQNRVTTTPPSACPPVPPLGFVATTQTQNGVAIAPPPAPLPGFVVATQPQNEVMIPPPAVDVPPPSRPQAIPLPPASQDPASQNSKWKPLPPLTIPPPLPDSENGLNSTPTVTMQLNGTQHGITSTTTGQPSSQHVGAPNANAPHTADARQQISKQPPSAPQGSASLSAPPPTSVLSPLPPTLTSASVTPFRASLSPDRTRDSRRTFAGSGGRDRGFSRPEDERDRFDRNRDWNRDRDRGRDYGWGWGRNRSRSGGDRHDIREWDREWDRRRSMEYNKEREYPPKAW